MVLAAAGVASRRASEELIARGAGPGRRRAVDRPGLRVDPATAVVTVDGDRVEVDPTASTCCSTSRAACCRRCPTRRAGRTVADLLGDRPERLFHVGRLDADSEGLLLLTNDGDLAHRLMHPASGCSKTYLAEVPAPIPRDLGAGCAPGVELDDGPVRVDGFRVVQVHGATGAGRGRAARGPQPHRAADARRGRPSGQPAGPHPDRPGRAGRPAGRRHPAAAPDELAALHRAITANATAAGPVDTAPRPGGPGASGRISEAPPPRPARGRAGPRGGKVSGARPGGTSGSRSGRPRG